jgi:methoxymalonate biosynthesis acyl carrier protein
MADQNLYAQIAAFFSGRLNLTVPSDTQDLFETGVLDSLAFVDLIMYLEQEFDIRISTDELEPDNFRSVAKIASFVTAHDGRKISMHPKANQRTAAR